jgi:hypothetical protein
MMNIADPKYLQYLRDLPSSYLLDLMVDNDDIDQRSLRYVLTERGFSHEEIDQKLARRRQSTWSRPYRLWSGARWLTIGNALIVTYFNLCGLYDLIGDDHAFKVPLLFLAFGSTLCGFFVGLKLTTHIYHGSQSMLYCGFPFPVGYVSLQTGEEIQRHSRIMTLNMALNALVGVSLTLFPLILIYVVLR